MGEESHMRKMMIMSALVVGVLAGACAPASAPAPIVVSVADADPTMVDALLAAGYRGIVGDHREAIYVPVGTVVDVAGGTWTAAPDGMARRTTGCDVVQTGMFNPCADLDTSRITDLRP